MTTVATELSIDALLRKRVHGAANIRGVRYQILAAVLSALERLPTTAPPAGIRLEGLEDFDRTGFQAGDEYVQVKFDAQSWTWSRMEGVIKSFLQILRAPGADPTAQFRLLVSFVPRKEIAALAERNARPAAERKATAERFRKVVRKLGGTDRDAADLLSRLVIESLPEPELWDRLRHAVADAFELGTEAVDTYLLVLVSRFLSWAEQRRTVTWMDLQEVRASIGEALAREESFQAYGRGLIERLEWVAAAEASDFFEGKGTRPSHVASGMDVRRPHWLARIAESTAAGRVCLVRAPSGQGKSALAYRAAREQGPDAGTFMLRIAKTEEDVEQVRHHLRFRANLGLPLLVLIDVDSRTRRWFEIAEECAELGIPTIVTIREEDWFRYGRESRFDYDVVEPRLDLDEAREIFSAFGDQGRIHPDVVSPEWAYERIGEPRLLLEYVYLLTHGRMLEERLSDQIRQFREQGESPGKLEILRRATLAHALGAGVSLRKLLSGIELRDDPQEVIGSMIGEYVQVRDGQVEGLHWVRSEHLAHLLHHHYPNPADTVLALLPAVETADLPTVISRAYGWTGLDQERLIDGLAEYAARQDAPLPLEIVDGLFEAGERRFFDEHRHVFDRAYEIGRSGGTFMLASAVLPVHQVDALERLEGLLPNVAGLRELAAEMPDGPRGLDLCRQFLALLAPHLTPERMVNDLVRSGAMLDWLGLCDVTPLRWAGIRDRLVAEPALFQLDTEDFCTFCRGFFRLDEAGYWGWFRAYENEILGYLKVMTDCLEITADRKVVRATFLVDPESDTSGFELRKRRADKLRSALPFAERYQTQGLWLSPFGLAPSLDETVLNAPRENYPFPSDASKNAVWGRIVSRSYFPDTHYQLQRSWYEARLNALEYVRWASKWLQSLIAGKPSRIDGVSFDPLVFRTREALRSLPNPSDRVAREVHVTLPQAAITALQQDGVSKWSFEFNNFFRQIHEYLVDQDKNSQRLLLVNFRGARSHLKDVHEAFGKLFHVVPDYFDAHRLDSRERNAYDELADVLEAWLVSPPPLAWRRDPVRFIRATRAQQEREKRNKVKAVLEDGGFQVVLASRFHIEHPLAYLAMYVEVNNPYIMIGDVLLAANYLSSVREVAEFFWLIPTWQGGRPFDRGYRFSAITLSKLADGTLNEWETLTPQEIPAEILATLPEVPVQLPYGHAVWYGMHALMQYMKVLEQWTEVLDGLGADPDPYSVEIRRRTEARRAEVGRKVLEQAETLRNAIRAAFDEVGDPAAVSVLERFIENSMHELTTGGYELPLEPDEETVGQTLLALFAELGSDPPPARPNPTSKT
jgi:hypothetical protein